MRRGQKKSLSRPRSLGTVFQGGEGEVHLGDRNRYFPPLPGDCWAQPLLSWSTVDLFVRLTEMLSEGI